MGEKVMAENSLARALAATPHLFLRDIRIRFIIRDQIGTTSSALDDAKGNQDGDHDDDDDDLGEHDCAVDLALNSYPLPVEKFSWDNLRQTMMMLLTAIHKKILPRPPRKRKQCTLPFPHSYYKMHPINMNTYPRGFELVRDQKVAFGPRSYHPRPRWFRKDILFTAMLAATTLSGHGSAF